MLTRARALPAGWYPTSPAALRSTLASWSLPTVEVGALAVLAPHAGWAFSGRLAAIAWSSLGGGDTLVVIGGHLGPASPILIATEDAFEGPAGPIAADRRLREALVAELGAASLPWQEDRRADNSVEVHLPLAALLRPGLPLLWIRAPASEASVRLGRALHQAALRAGRRALVVASSDLTHYGPDYGFEPPEARADPPAWLRDRNDRAYLDALLALDAGASLATAKRDCSACSAGAAAAALAFALEGGATRAELLGYGTSHETRPGPSLVGYAALGFFGPSREAPRLRRDQAPAGEAQSP